MLKYTNRHIIFTDTNIISMELKGTRVHGTVTYYDRETGAIESPASTWTTSPVVFTVSLIGAW